MPDHPRYIVTVGDDAQGGGIFSEAYGVLGHLPPDMQAACIDHIEGPVPTPRDLLLKLCDIVDKRDNDRNVRYS